MNIRALVTVCATLAVAGPVQADSLLEIYQQALQSELCGDVPSRRPDRTNPAEKAAAETPSWASSQ